MRPDGPLRHAKHVARAALMLIVGLVAIVLGRSLFVPATWGDHGPYRGANVAEQMALPIQHAGNATCAACHEEQRDDLIGGGHASLECESCHAPVSEHARDEEKIADMPIRREIELCLTCHQELDARPAGFPQIQPKRHVAENEGEFHDQVCLDCHEAHVP
jgi:predicted CXXCH cytochrome family protein